MEREHPFPHHLGSQIATSKLFKVIDRDLREFMPTKPKQNAGIAVNRAIDDKIYVVRGQRVMLDSDLAEVYQVETKALKRAVRRNRHRFPEDFLFEMSLDETRQLESLRRQFGTFDESNRGI